MVIVIVIVILIVVYTSRETLLASRLLTAIITSLAIARQLFSLISLFGSILLLL